MGYYLEGTLVDTITITPASGTVVRSYAVLVTDGQLNLRIDDLGGADPNAIINALTIVDVTPPPAPPADGFLQGYVYVDADGNDRLDPGEAIAGARVELTDLTGAISHGVRTTDASGYYRFDGVAPGDYTLVQREGGGYRGLAAQAVSTPIHPILPGGSGASIRVRVTDPDAITSLHYNAAALGAGPHETVLVQVGAQHIASYIGAIPIFVSGAGATSATFYAFCLDPTQLLGPGYQFPISVEEIPWAANGAGNAPRIAYLYNRFGASASASALDDSIEMGALQLAIWELLSDAAPDFYAGAFQNVRPGSGGSSTPQSDVDAMLARALEMIAESAGKEAMALKLEALPGAGRQSMIATSVIHFQAEPDASAAAPTGSLSGYAYLDLDDDGRKDAGEAGLGGVVVVLTGVTDGGGAVAVTTRTARDGSYRFEQLEPGTYSIRETPPDGYIDAKDTPGDRGGAAGPKRFTGILLAEGVEGRGYNFGHQRAPVFTTEPIREARAGVTYTYQVGAEDPDGDDLRYTLVHGPAGLSMDASGRITWYSPTTGVPRTVAVRVEDLRNELPRRGVAEMVYTLTVVASPDNRSPYFTSTPIVDANVSTTYSYQSTALDLDFDPVSFRIVSGPEGLAIAVPSSGLIRWTPAAHQLGTHDVLVEASDGRGGVETQAYKILVRPAPGNSPPVIVSSPVLNHRIPGFAAPGASLTLSTTVRDFRIDHPDFEEAYSGRAGGVVQQMLGDDGKPVYAGHDGRARITNAMTFDQWYRDTPGVNRTTIIPLQMTLQSNGKYKYHNLSYFPIDGRLFGNEGLPNNFHFTMELHAQFTYQGNGNETFRFWGDDDTWVFIDGRLVVDNAGINDGVEGLVDLDDLGLTVGRSYAFDFFHAERKVIGSYFSFETGVVLEQRGGYRYDVDAIDPDGDPITYELIPTPGATPQPPPAGMRFDQTTGLITWDSLDVAPGTYPVTVRARDDRGGYSLPHSFVITVTAQPGNTAPHFVDPPPDPVRVVAGERLTYVVRAVDPDGDPVSLRLVDQPGSTFAGVEFDPATGLLTWTPGLGDVGAAPKNIYIVADDGRPNGQATLLIHPLVTRRGNLEPTLVPIADQSAEAGQTFSYQAIATDGDHDPLEFDLPIRPAGMIVDRDRGRVIWYPTRDQAGRTHDVTLRVSDGLGGAALRSFRIAVTSFNHDPMFYPGPLSVRASAGTALVLLARAFDPDDDPLAYSLAGDYPSGLGFHDPARPDVLTWPAAAQGSFEFFIIASDGRGGVASQPVELVIEPDPGNLHGPVIGPGSAYRTSIQVDRTYLYQVVASDGDGDPLTYGLAGATPGAPVPAGVEISGSTGLVRWTPMAGQFGDHSFRVTVSDGRGRSAEQLVVVRVVAQGSNVDPVIDTTGAPWAVAGQAYLLQLAGHDPDNDPIAWGFARTADGGVRAPAGMIIDPRRGTIAWAPTAGQIGTHPVTVRLEDGQGGWTNKTFQIVVRGENTPPGFVTLQLPPAVAGTAGYNFRIEASDPEGDAVTFALIGGQAGGPTVDEAGLLQWANPTQVGWKGVTVRVEDGRGGWAERTYFIRVLAAAEAAPDSSFNQAPALDPIGDVTAARGASVRIDARADDDDLDLSYTLEVTSGPVDPATGLPWRWLQIDSSGRIAGAAGAQIPLGTYTIRVVATDPLGVSSGPEDFSVTVVDDTTGPTVRVRVLNAGNSVGEGEVATIQVTASDDVGVVSLTLTVGGVPVRLDGHGVGTVSRAVADDYAVVATATDAAGNTSSSAATLHVIDPSVTSRPTATILSPSQGSGASPVPVIAAPTAVRFTASGANLASYTLAYAPLDTDDWTVLDAGTASVTDRVVPFDPTRLANGAYTLRLTARNTGGIESVDERVVSVEGNLKLGNFRVSFVDLAIPVAGLPITITRTYDSLDAGEDGDFGHGWRLEETGFRVQVSQPDGTLADAGLHRPLRAGTRVVITRPGHDPEAFIFLPRQRVSGYFGTQYYQPEFVPVSGVTSRLTVSDAVLVKFGEDFVNYDADMTPYNPADPVANTSRAYNLTARDGSVYVFDAETGRIATVSDRAGRTLTFTDDGIFSDTGRGVTFVRDPQTRRIRKIIDPEGREITYGYDDVTGDLLSVTAPFEGTQTSTTQFVYDDPARPHFLKRVIDPLGRPAATTHYYPDGRIERVVDADGKQTIYEWHADTLVQRVTDQLDRTTVLTLDARGNVLREVAPDGGITKRTYDAEDRLRSETVVVGLEDSPQNGESNDLTTTYDYVGGNLDSTTDPRGNVTSYTYNDFGQLTGVATKDGGTTSHYDEYGLLRWTRDAVGNVTTFDYDRRGNLTFIRKGDGTLLVSSTYNSYGELTSTTPAGGRATYLDYAAGGEVVGRWYFDGEGAGRVQVLDVTRHDDAGRVVGTIHAVLPEGQFLTANLDAVAIPPQYVEWTTGTTYNKAGQVLTETDRFGRVTEHTYDARGQEIQVRTGARGEDGTPTWLVTRTVYDAAGRVAYRTDPYAEGTPTAEITGTWAEVVDLDGASFLDGRVETVRRLKGLNLGWDATGPFPKTSFVAHGPILETTTTRYDKAGRVVSSIDADELETRHAYNRHGESVETRTQSYDQTNQLVWLVTRTVYDARGRAVLTTDPHVEGPAYATETVYDDQGRAFRSIRRQGVQVVLVDGETATTDEGTELWHTETVYDVEGRVRRTIAADGQVTEYEYDALGRREAVIGHPVVVSYPVVNGEQTLRLRTETDYDPQGRVWRVRTGLRQRTDGTFDASDVRQTVYEYDESDNLIRTTFADLTTIEAAYDGFGRKASETNQLGKTRTFAYDAFTGRLTAVELPAAPDPDNNGTPTRPRYEYAYDAWGNQTLIRDPLGHETRFTYDARGNQLTRTLPMGFGPDGELGTADDGTLPEGSFTERSEYDHRGRQILHVSFEGVVTRSVYGLLTGRLSERRFFASEAAYANGAGNPDETWRYTYDAFGRTVKVVQDRPGLVDDRTTATAYDGEGRVTRVATPEGAVNHEYDAHGRLIRTYTTTEAGTTPIDDTYYDYDALGRMEMVSVRKQDGVALAPNAYRTTAYGYDMLGNLVWVRQPNGVMAVYTYDSMDRLETLTYYEPGASLEFPEEFPAIARYVYQVRDDGRREGVTETTWFDDNGDGYASRHDSTTAWEYDDLGRLIGESIDHYVNGLDRAEHFVYDLAGNRRAVKLDRGRNNSIDETTDYEYDANDRLKVEGLDTTGDGVAERTTIYEFNATQQAGKEVKEGGTTVSDAISEYDLQGRLKRVTVATHPGGGTHVERTSYAYGPDGIRARSTHEVDAAGDGTFESGDVTAYLVDADNPTGYGQVVRETTSNRDGGATKKVVAYTVGHDVIAQSTTAYSSGQPGAAQVRVFGYDGHGSTRFLTGPGGALATDNAVRQVFDYDAYGNFLGFDATKAATSLLYSGEMFDARIGQQYLRARWYDPNTGRFNRIDPFFGNLEDPQSLHKYLYTHGDPINGIDPTGMYTGLSGFFASFSLSGSLRGMSNGAILGAFSGAVTGAADAYTENADLREALNGAVFGGLSGLTLGALTGGIGGGFANYFKALPLVTKTRLLKIVLATDTISSVFGVATAKTTEQSIFRGSLGLIGAAASIASVQQLMIGRERLLARFVELGTDAGQGRFVAKQGLGGLRLEQFFGRRADASNDPAYDFLVGSKKIELKGPFLTPNRLDFIPNFNINGAADEINVAIYNKRASVDAFVIDMLGLSDEQAYLLSLRIRTDIAEVHFIR